MKVRVHLPRKFGKVTYQKGVHELPEKLKDDWFFQGAIKEGAIALEPKEEQMQAKAPVGKGASAKPQPEGK